MSNEEGKAKENPLPKMICENCGYYNQLSFAPLSDPEALWHVHCKNCLELAYYKYYLSDKAIADFARFFPHGLVREFIKMGKLTYLEYGKC